MSRRNYTPFAAAVLFFGVALAFQRGEIASLDGKVYWKVAQSLVHDRSFTPHFPVEWGPIPLHTPYSSFAIGLSVALTPFVWLQDRIDPNGLGIVTLANPVFLAACVAMIVLITQRLNIRRWIGVSTALGFGFLTTALWHSTEVFSEPLVTLALLIALYGLLVWRDGNWNGSAILGLGLAGALLVRTDSLVTILPIALVLPCFVPVQELKRRWKHWIPYVIVPLGVVVAWTLFYNVRRYGTMTEAGYPGYGFTTSIRDGLDLLLLSPGKGIFWYSPIALLAVVLFAKAFRSQRAFAVALAAICGLRILFYMRWVSPEGGVAWGPRFMLPLYAAAVLIIALGSESIVTNRGKSQPIFAFFGVILSGASLVVNLVSVWVPYEQYYNEFRYQRAGERFADLQARLHWFVHSFWEGHINANWYRLPNARPFPLKHFDNGIHPVGGLAIGIILLGITGLWVSRNRRDSGHSLVPGVTREAVHDK